MKVSEGFWVAVLQNTAPSVQKRLGIPCAWPQPFNHTSTQRFCFAPPRFRRKRVNFTLLGIRQMTQTHVLHTQLGARIAGVFPALKPLGEIIHIFRHLDFKRDQLVAPACG